MNHRGNVSPMHNRMQDELVDILERLHRAAGRRPRVHKEHHVPNQQGGEFVVDVADQTVHPQVYYELEERPSGKIKRYREAFAAGTGVDVVVLYVSEMRKTIGRNPRVNDLRRWITERIV
jgi:hypothetical protein